MKRLRLLLWGVTFFTGCQLYGQAKLGVNVTNLPTQYNIDSSYSTSVNFDIINYGGETFTGSITLQYTINGAYNNGDASNGFLQFPTASVSIGKGDTVHETMGVVVNQNTFSTIGTSVVVIWPFSLSALTYDSIESSIQVDSSPVATGLASVLQLNSQLFISHQQLHIQSAMPGCYKHVRIYNLIGQLLMEEDLASSTCISMHQFSAECYLVELTFVDNSQKVYKVINMN